MKYNKRERGFTTKVQYTKLNIDTYDIVMEEKFAFLNKLFTS
jgi:hypothetical protein